MPDAGDVVLVQSHFFLHFYGAAEPGVASIAGPCPSMARAFAVWSSPNLGRDAVLYNMRSGKRDDGFEPVVRADPAGGWLLSALTGIAGEKRNEPLFTSGEAAGRCGRASSFDSICQNIISRR